ncbi:hypothetical protein DFH11DRAFT_74416 [Phellopilus nigrolimitatus]|nr:hypothetical protein DFH11DRAFT_74416 [Phellopilus nigrolimitatus]
MIYGRDASSSTCPNEPQTSVSSPTNTVSSGYSVAYTSWGSPSSRSSATSGSSSSGYTYVNVKETQVSSTSRMQPPHEPHRYVALSTQFVYAGAQRVPVLARVSVTDYRGNVLYDSFVRPTIRVEDYRTLVTGLQAEHLASAPHPAAVREQVSAIVRGKIVVGHSMWIHFSLLGMCHPAIDTRDVALFLPFHRTLSSSSVKPLKTLVSHLMRRKIGQGYEHPLEEARAALDLFRSYEDQWEDEVRAGAWPSALPPSSYGRFFT